LAHRNAGIHGKAFWRMATFAFTATVEAHGKAFAVQH
jgi:hypothetical protein